MAPMCVCLCVCVCVCVCFPALPFQVWQGVFTSLHSELICQPFWEQKLDKQNKGWGFLVSVGSIHDSVTHHSMKNEKPFNTYKINASLKPGSKWPSGSLLPDIVMCLLADGKQGASTNAKQSSSRWCRGLWHCSTGRADSPPGIHWLDRHQWRELFWLQATVLGWGTEAKHEEF